MKSREELNKQMDEAFGTAPAQTIYQAVITEVLFDIRDLLIEIKKSINL